MTRLVDDFSLLALPVLLATLATPALAQVPAPDDFVLFADDTIRARGLDVQSGDVGANLSITATKPLQAPVSRIVTDAVSLHPGSTCDALLATRGQTTPDCGPAGPVTLPIIANVGAACGITSPLPTQCVGQAPGIAVGHGVTQTKNPGTYGDVDVAGGGHGRGTLRLSAGTYTFCSLTLHRNAQLLALGPVTIQVVGGIKFDNGSDVGPEPSGASPCQVRIFTNGTRVRISRKASVAAILCAPNALLELTVGAHLHGAFFANAVKTDKVTLVHETCPPLGTSTSTTSSSTSTSPTSSTTTTPTTSSTSTSAPPTRCCLGSPGGAFTCVLESAAACANDGGIDVGPGACIPDPCRATTSSTSTPSTTSMPPSTIPTTSSTSTLVTTSSTSTVPTTTSTSGPSTSSTSSSTSTTPTSTSSITTTTGVTGFDFTSTAGTGVCGHTFRDLAGTIPLKKLLCGNLSIGGGFSSVPDNVTPSGATNRFGLSCSGSTCAVGPVAPATAAYECSDTGCLFGTPLPIANAGISVCVTNTFSMPASGTLDTGTGAASLHFELNSATVLTGNATQPCPICAVAVGGAPCVGSPAAPCTGVCDGSPNQGAACMTKNPNGLTNECPSPAVVVGTRRCYRGPNNNNVCTSNATCAGAQCVQFIGDIPISLNPLTTGTASLSNADGLFCPGQGAPQRGAFKSDICQTGANSGMPCTSATAIADCGAGVSCRLGSANNYCSAGANIGLGCASNTDCGTGGVCTRAGLLAQLIRLDGTPTGPLSCGMPKSVRLASAFCVPLTDSSIVNSSANLPGPGATTLVGRITLLCN